MGVRTYSYDALMVMADGAAATTANGIGQVSAANKILDLGGALTRTDIGIVGGLARMDAAIVIDVSAIVTAATDLSYSIDVMGSNNANGSAPVHLGGLKLGNFTLLPNGLTGSAGTGVGSTSVAGRFEIMVSTEQADIKYQYVYLYNTGAGATKSITYKAFMAVLPEI